MLKLSESYNNGHGRNASQCYFIETVLPWHFVCRNSPIAFCYLCCPSNMFNFQFMHKLNYSQQINNYPSYDQKLLVSPQTKYEEATTVETMSPWSPGEIPEARGKIFSCAVLIKDGKPLPPANHAKEIMELARRYEDVEGKRPPKEALSAEERKEQYEQRTRQDKRRAAAFREKCAEIESQKLKERQDWLAEKMAAQMSGLGLSENRGGRM